MIASSSLVRFNSRRSRGQLLIGRTAVARKRAAAVVAEFALPAVDEPGSDVEVTGSLRDVAGALSGADSFEFVPGRGYS